VARIAEERIGHPSDVLEVDQTVKARIIGINEEKRQVRLSLRKPREVAPPQQQRPQRRAQREAPSAPAKEYSTGGEGGSMTLREHLEQKEEREEQ